MYPEINQPVEEQQAQQTEEAQDKTMSAKDANVPAEVIIQGHRTPGGVNLMGRHILQVRTRFLENIFAPFTHMFTLSL